MYYVCVFFFANMIYSNSMFSSMFSISYDIGYKSACFLYFIQGHFFIYIYRGHFPTNLVNFNFKFLF